MTKESNEEILLLAEKPILSPPPLSLIATTIGPSGSLYIVLERMTVKLLQRQ